MRFSLPENRAARAGVVAGASLAALVAAIAVALVLGSLREIEPGIAQSTLEEGPKSGSSVPSAEQAQPMEAAAWCAADGPAGNRSLVQAAAVEYLGLDAAMVGDSTPIPEGDPFWDAACRVAYELWALTDDEWNWCFDAANRESFLGPAIQLLGLGDEEAAGTESFAEAPGDDPAEYTQACRLAYRFLRHDGVASIPPEAVDELAWLDPAESGWC